MGSSTLVVMTVISAFTDLCAGGTYGSRIVRQPSYYDSWRNKRQSHPQATQVRIPEVAFADSVSLSNPPQGVVAQAGPTATGGLLDPESVSLVNPGTVGLLNPDTVALVNPVPDGLPDIADYLTPPPPEDSLIQQQQQQRQDGKWELGFDANEILVPPSDQARQYDTLKLFTLLPTSSESEPSFGETFKEILNQQLDNSPAGSNSHEFTHPRQFGQHPDRDVPYRPPPPQKGPVYTYVKTDKRGNFKWGVRHGH